MRNGVDRAKTLQSEVVRSKSGGKTVKIADQFAAGNTESPDAGFLKKIDEAFFTLKNVCGREIA